MIVSQGPRSATCRRQRSTALAAGFTLIEMTIVLVVMGVLVSIMVRSVRGSWVANSRRAAIRDATSYLVRTRAIAVQQSRTAWLVRSGSVLKVLVDSSGTPGPRSTLLRSTAPARS